MPAPKKRLDQDQAATFTAQFAGGSTTWEYRKVMITRPAASPSARARRAADQPSADPSTLRNPKTVTLKWRGGSEAWVEIRTTAGSYRFPGHVPIAEVLLHVYGVR